MSTSSTQAAAAAIKEVSRDPVIKKFMEQLAVLLEAWFVHQGYFVGMVELHSDYLLNGNLGKQSAFFLLKNPDGGDSLRVVCELRAFSQGDAVFAILRVRQNWNGPTAWKSLDSAQVQVHFPSHPGEYKLQLLTQRMRAMLGMNEQINRLDETLVPPMLLSVMAEARASFID